MELLHSKKLSGAESGASTQKYVDVEEVKDGVIILKDGSLRAVLLVSSINFELKSTEEQEAIINQYQNFLNSLDFPVQVLISSRKLNIGPYLDYIKEKEHQQTNELLRLQMSEYRNFIKNLTDISNIMSKYFYIVVPFHPVESKEGGFFSRISAMFHPKQAAGEKKEILETYKNQLWQRLDHISAALTGVGLKLVPLKTDEMLELLYNSYNPSVFTATVIKDVDQLELEKI